MACRTEGRWANSSWNAAYGTSCRYRPNHRRENDSALTLSTADTKRSCAGRVVQRWILNMHDDFRIGSPSPITIKPKQRGSSTDHANESSCETKWNSRGVRRKKMTAQPNEMLRNNQNMCVPAVCRRRRCVPKFTTIFHAIVHPPFKYLSLRWRHLDVAKKSVSFFIGRVLLMLLLVLALAKQFSQLLNWKLNTRSSKGPMHFSVILLFGRVFVFFARCRFLV